jgi:CBS domain-containing protein
MQAKDLMTTNVVVVTPDTTVRDIAQVMLAHAISAVPVVDKSGTPVGMVSEGDLIARSKTDRDSRRDWWLTLLAEGHALSPDFLSSLGSIDETAKDIMAAPVIAIDEKAEATEIARLLGAYRIKRLPVVRDGRIVGIVSRADLLKALVAEQPANTTSKSAGFLAAFVSEIDDRFSEAEHKSAVTPTAHPGEMVLGDKLNAAEFRRQADDFKHQKSHRQDEEKLAAVEKRNDQVKTLIDTHIDNDAWRLLLHAAHEAAERGEKEFMLLRFPSQLCGDGGRAINIMESGWEKTLRGEAAEIYTRWEHDLMPHGFHLKAQVLEFPGGFPGDIGLTLIWGE